MIKKYKRHDWSRLFEIYVYYPFDGLKDFAEVLSLNYGSSQFWKNCKNWGWERNVLIGEALLNFDIEIIDMLIEPDTCVNAGEYEDILNCYLSSNKGKSVEKLYSRALSFYPSFKKDSRINSTIAYISTKKS